MEPWLLEELRQRRRRPAPLCRCCLEPVASERYLLLDRFGLEGAACEKCVERGMRYCEIFEQEDGI